MIQFIMTDTNGKVLERELISPKAAKDVIVGAIVGLVPDQKSADEQIHNIIKTINEGGTVEIKHPDTGVSFILQTPSMRKEKEAMK